MFADGFGGNFVKYYCNTSLEYNRRRYLLRLCLSFRYTVRSGLARYGTWHVLSREAHELVSKPTIIIFTSLSTYPNVNLL